MFSVFVLCETTAEFTLNTYLLKVTVMKLKKNVPVQFVMLYILFHPTTKATEVITWGDMSY